jgi:hypothetical protein
MTDGAGFVHEPLVTHVRAELDGSRVGVLGELFPLLFAGGSSETEDHPGFARAASAVRRWERRLVVIQDDIDAIAVGGSAASTPFAPALLGRGITS